MNTKFVLAATMVMVWGVSLADTCYVCEDPVTHTQTKSSNSSCPLGMNLIGGTITGSCPGSPKSSGTYQCTSQAQYSGAPKGCADLKDMKCLGWKGGDKGQFCRSNGFDGNTNPTVRGYKVYGNGGFCFKGEPTACQIASGEKLLPDSSSGCKALVDMKSLGWNGGHKGNFCKAKGFDSNYNPDSLGYTFYASGGLCYQGPEKACVAAADKLGQELSKLPKGGY